MKQPIATSKAHQDFMQESEEFKSYIQTRLKGMDIENSFINSKISNWLSKAKSELNSSNQVKQKKKELIDLGKFIYCFNHDIIISEAICESPDFIISLNDKRIGLELSDLVISENEKQKEGFLKKIITRIEIELRELSDDFNGIYRINFRKGISLNSKVQQVIKSEIKSMITGEIAHGNFIESIRKIPHTNISIYHSEASIVGPLERSIVEANIKNKEANIFNYRSGQLDEIWLLLTIGGIQTSDDYAYVEEDIFNLPYQTNYDKVFLMNFFKSEVIALPTKRS